MNFEQRVESIVDRKFSEMLDLFQTTERRTDDLLPVLQKLLNTIPLIEDIKTEVNSIEKKIQNRPSDKDDGKKRRNPDRQQPTIEDQREVNELLEWFQQLLPEPQEDLLLLPGPLGGGGSDWDPSIQKYLLRLLLGLKKLDDKINKGVLDWLTTKKIDNLMNNIESIRLDIALTEANIKRAINEAKNELSQSLSDISDALEECCDVQSQKLDSISRKIDNLNPDRQANQDLAIIQQGKSIRNEIFSLRGLL